MTHVYMSCECFVDLVQMFDHMFEVIIYCHCLVPVDIIIRLIAASLSFAFLLDCSNVVALKLYSDFETENDFIVMLLVHTCRTKYFSDGICGSQVSHCFGFKPLLTEKMAQRTNQQYIARATSSWVQC